MKHGEFENGAPGSDEYWIWVNMRQRCNNPNNHAFAYYGGRGVKVCDRWEESFDNFLEDMGRRPSNKHSIDRLKNDEGYGPGNCAWRTMKEQCNNRSNARRIDGLTIEDVAALTGLTYSGAYTRLVRGWPIADILACPKGNDGKRNHRNSKGLTCSTA